jgi:hypothetical protein
MWEYIGAYPSNSFDELVLTNKERLQTNIFGNNLKKYNISTDTIYALGTKCFYCDRSTRKKLIYYLYDDTNKQFRVLGSSCISRYEEFTRKCSICGERYSYHEGSCGSCEKIRAHMNLTFKQLRDNKYLAFCVATVYGNINCDFSKYILDSGIVKYPNVTYEYHQSGYYENCSIYHTHLQTKYQLTKYELTPAMIKAIDFEIRKRCICCGIISTKWSRISLKFGYKYLCEECSVVEYTFRGRNYHLLHALSSLLIQPMLGYIYANDDVFSDFMKACYYIETIDTDINDVIECDGTKFDRVIMYSYQKFQQSYLDYTREQIREMMKACPYCGEFDMCILGNICSCDNMFTIITVENNEIIHKRMSLRQYAEMDKKMIQLHIDSSDDEVSIFLNKLGYEKVIYESDIFISGLLLESALINAGEWASRELMDRLNDKSLTYALMNIYKYRNLIKKLLEIPFVCTEINKLIKGIGTKRLKFQGKMISINTLCRGKLKPEFEKALRENTITELLKAKPLIMEYYNFHTKP